MTETPGRASSKKGIHVYTYFFLCLFVSFFLSLFLSMCCFFLYGPFVSWYVPLFGALCGSCSVQTTSLVYLTMDGRGKVLFFWSSFFVPSKVLHASGPSHAQRPPARPPEGGGYRGQRPLTVRKSCTSPWWCRSTTTAAVERVSISLKGRVPEGWPSKVLHAVAGGFALREHGVETHPAGRPGLTQGAKGVTFQPNRSLLRRDSREAVCVQGCSENIPNTRPPPMHGMTTPRGTRV